MADIFEEITIQTASWRSAVSDAAHTVRDFTRRLELILSQDRRKIPVRDTTFSADFTQFCTQLREQTDQTLQYWQQTRQQLRQSLQKQKPTSLQAKSFTLRAKAFSRACDELTSAYDRFNEVYQNYTLTKLPVWILTACCDDINNWSGKILFLTREMTKHTLAQKRTTHAQ